MLVLEGMLFWRAGAPSFCIVGPNVADEANAFSCVRFDQGLLFTAVT